MAQHLLGRAWLLLAAEQGLHSQHASMPVPVCAVLWSVVGVAAGWMDTCGEHGALLLI